MKVWPLALTLLATLIPLSSAAGLKGTQVQQEEEQRIVYRLLSTDVPGTNNDPAGSDPNSGSTGSTSCFSAESQVQVEGKGSVAMKDLQVGDRVLTGNNKYEEMYAFGHYHRTAKTEFIQIHTTQKIKLEMTAKHLVYLEGETHPKPADTVKVGDVLQTADLHAVVTKIRSIVRNDGLYAPLTPSGTIVVNGILASNYIAVQDGISKGQYVEMKGGIALFSQHDFEHLAMFPFRSLCMSSSLSFCHQYNQEGVSTYVANAIDFAHWAESQSIFVQVLLVVAYTVFGAGVLLAENHSWALSVLAAAVLVVKYNGFRIRTSIKNTKTL